MGLGSAIGGIFGAGASAYGQKQQLKWEREKAQNAHQWEVQDLIKAGLNPILSAGGSGASAGSIGGIDGGSITEGINAAETQKIAEKDLKLREEKQKAEIKNQTKLTNAQVENENANTARTLALTPEEIKSHQWNRVPHAIKEIGGSAIKVAEILSEMGDRTAEWLKYPHSERAKKYVEEHPEQFPHLKIKKHYD